MQYVYPHTIETGHGEVLTFLNRVQSGSREFLEVENTVKPGVGPPMHVHHMQDECLTVVQGRIAALVQGQEPTFHGPGETITFYRGVPHRFWNAGDDLLICKGYIDPPNNVEYYLTEMFRSIKESKSSRPSLFDTAYLLTRYKTEFDLMEIPELVKRVVFPVVVGVGTMLGYDKKFKDCPEPVL